MATAEIKVSLTDLEPVKTLLAELAFLHRKSDDTVEIEVWHDDEGGGDGCPEPDSRGRCNGHVKNIHICNECGTTYDNWGELAWIEWPCRTALRLSASIPTNGKGH
jgi:hypothetical protein